MPFSQIWSRNGVHAKFFGVLAKEDLMLQKAEIFLLHRAENIKYIIIDLLDVEGADLSIADVRDFARMSDEMFRLWEGVRKVKLPVVATKRDLIDLTEEYVESYRGGVLVPKIFSNAPDAMAWAET